MLNIKITSDMLATLLGGEFTYEGCQALVNYLEDAQDYDKSFVPTIGDIAISFSEVENDDDVEEDSIIAKLGNGHVIVTN